jgi:hypothetical protein
MANNFNEIPEYDNYLGNPPIGEILVEVTGVCITSVQKESDFLELATSPWLSKYRDSRGSFEAVKSELHPTHLHPEFLIQVDNNHGYLPIAVLGVDNKFKARAIVFNAPAKSIKNINDFNAAVGYIEYVLILAITKFFEEYDSRYRDFLTLAAGELGCFFNAYEEKHPYIKAVESVYDFRTPIKWSILARALENLPVPKKYKGSREMFGEQVVFTSYGKWVVLVRLTYEEVADFFDDPENALCALYGEECPISIEDVYGDSWLSQDYEFQGDLAYEFSECVSEDVVNHIKASVLGRKIKWYDEDSGTEKTVEVTEEFLTETFAKQFRVAHDDFREILFMFLRNPGKENYPVFKDIYGIFLQIFKDAASSLLGDALHLEVMAAVKNQIGYPVDFAGNHVDVFISGGDLQVYIAGGLTLEKGHSLKEHLCQSFQGTIYFSDVAEAAAECLDSSDVLALAKKRYFS